MFGLLGLPLAAIAVAVLAFAWTNSGTDQVEAADPGAMNLTVKSGGIGGACDDTKCDVLNNGDFQLTVAITKAPVAGYIGIGTEVTIPFPGLKYTKKAGAADEIVWAQVGQGLIVRSNVTGVSSTTINHGSATASSPPFPLSNLTGNIVTLNMTCNGKKASHVVNLVPLSGTNTDGSGFKLTATTSATVAADSITINCVNPPPPTVTPTATATPDNPSFVKKAALQNLFLTRQGAKIPPANCKASSDQVVAVTQLDIPIADQADPKDSTLRQQLGAFEFEVKYDQTKVCVDVEPGPAANAMTCFIQDSNNAPTLDGVARIGCVTLGKNTFPDTNNPVQRILAVLTIRPQPNEYSIIKPNQDNGNVTQILNVGCTLSDLQGHPIKLINCAGADVTIRYLEGDVNPDCQVNALDAAAIAARWGASKGNLLYNDFFNLEPVIPADQDIDINDIQFVFGRFGSTCGSPHPPQDPVNPKA